MYNTNATHKTLVMIQ